MKDYETIIGLEIHIELDTKTKLFCSCSTEFGARANTNICPICMGMPGALPVLNERVVDLAVRAGIVFNSKINSRSSFDRKNYFYPDQPKGYQITQWESPICIGGYYDLEVGDGKKRINIERIHIEEDAGKLIHSKDENISLVDYNRAGAPLIEIVTRPDFRSADEVNIFLRDLRRLLQYTGISDGKMQEGSLRCDVNISMKEISASNFNKKVELKNLNSFREIDRAILVEEKLQGQLYREGREDEILEETKRWDEGLGKNISMRSKDEEEDYRYFPESDLLDIHIDEDYIGQIADEIPELPKVRRHRIMEKYNIDKMQMDILMENKVYIDYFEAVIAYGSDPNQVANWITGDVIRVLKERNIRGHIPIKPVYLSRLIELIDGGHISRKIGRKIFNKMVDMDKSPEVLVEEMGLRQISNKDELEEVVERIIDNNPRALEDYKNGKLKSLGYMMGEIMKATRGKANPPMVKDILLDSLNKRL